MARDRISASIDEDLAEWVKEHSMNNSDLVEEGLKRIYEEEKYGREQTLKRKKKELEKEMEEYRTELEGLKEEVEKIDEELEDIESVEERLTEKVCDYAISLIPTQPDLRSYDSVGQLSEDDVKEVLAEADIHYARWRGGQPEREDVPDGLKRRVEDGDYETGRYGQVQNREDFEDAYHRLSEGQKNIITEEIEARF